MGTRAGQRGPAGASRPAGTAAQKKTRIPRVRVRCNGETTPEEVQAEVKSALPHIVRATVQKARGGSLPHTKWLWELANATDARAAAEQANGGPSLAQLLLEQLEQG